MVDKSLLAGQRVWHLKVTVHFLADAGDMLDCACLVSVVALKHFRQPDIEVIGDEITAHAPSDRAPVPLSTHHTPFCLTFAFFPRLPSSTPSQLEQRLSAGLLSIVLNAQRVLHKAGGVLLVSDEILDIVDVAAVRAKELDKIVASSLRADWEGQKKF